MTQQTTPDQTLQQKTATYVQQLPAGAIAAQVNAALREHPRLVVTAPPGAGKSTLLPLTILHNMPQGKILMLEPRRLAARQIAVRMAQMLGEQVGQTVGYRMRFDTMVSAHTRIEVITEGILSRMIIDDPTLEDVYTIIFDEFHERSLASDTALALTLEAQQIVRPDLRVVIMSATIDTTAICQALQAPSIESQGRMFPVTIVHSGEDTDAQGCSADVASAVRRAHAHHEGDILAFLPGQADIVRCQQLLAECLGPQTLVCALYGLLAPETQQQALSPAPAGWRKVVLATPIAETSLTIEGVRVVVDSGLCRTLVFDPQSGLSRLQTVRVSLDMARQRAGRAGRMAEGVCYQLWTKATELRMDECRRPEILDADLATTLLSIATWGEPNAAGLPWLTPPPAGHLAQAATLLSMLGATDAGGRITAHGRRLSALPCHPRIAQMLLLHEGSDRALAADIAALLEEKDPLPADTADADINTRIALLRDMRRNHKSGKWGHIMHIAAQYRRMAGAREDNTPPHPMAAGALIAAAWPERIAQRTADGRYRLCSGDFATLAREDDLSACPLLAVAKAGSRIFLAAPLAEESLADKAVWTDTVCWDSRQGRAMALRELRVGVLVLATKPAGAEARPQVVRAICDAAPKEGLTMFDFSAAVTRMQLRLATVAAWHPELQLPCVDTAALLQQASQWLPLYIGQASSVQELRRIDLCEVIWGLLSYEQQTAVDRIAPTHIQLPSGRNVRLDYRQGAEVPVLSARLQDCFGLTNTPRVDGGQKPVLMELLSPGFKPVQLTQDLTNFWQHTYFEVRKELRRRYPKHRWPDNPTER